ncbi:hypothetical protein TNCV_1126221 [Trichonephila clavipes]|nr:hypothetical protein TNCV_1126221 [Trichonephila clavipes]
MMNSGVSNIIPKQSDKVRNGSHKIHRKQRNQGKFHPKSKQCSLHSSIVREIHEEFVPTGQTFTGQYHLAVLKRLMVKVRSEYWTESS